ncbi:putative hydrolase of the HAD superfamily [Spiroplasma gladiatoris]|uniref:Putative hydrolase of the HAD superfamily n=2 Tax=Spiroplasma gladiatoris TaxID=2143 RepID=A0A4P7AJ53_9MOLU|nr:putative hydrolase of the HAD superfamily [Spiroplasma gladiatoris]
MLKSIYKLLSESECDQIEFYEPQEGIFRAKNETRIINDVYKISYINNNYKTINFFIVFNKNEFLYKVDNKKTKSWEIDVTNKDSREIEDLIDFYSTKESNMGLTMMKNSMQSNPIRFIDSLDENEINIYVEILKYENLVEQSTTIADYMYFNNFKKFLSEFLPLFL